MKGKPWLALLVRVIRDKLETRILMSITFLGGEASISSYLLGLSIYGHAYRSDRKSVV